jgi:hypothetical protein
MGAALVVLGGTAWAQGPSAEDIKVAGAEFDLGKQSYKKRAWADAAEHFEAADARAPSAVAIELAVRARDKAGQLDRAATLAELARKRHPKEASLVKLAEGVVKRARGKLHALSVKCEPGCDLVLGTKLVHGGAARERLVFLNPGGVQVSASWPGDRSRVAPVNAVEGGTGELAFEAPPEEKPAPTEPAAPVAVTAPVRGTPKPVTTRVGAGGSGGDGLPPAVFFIGAGLTVVAGGFTIWSGIDTQNNPGTDAVREACAGKGESCPEYQDGVERQNRTNILLGVTAGLAVTSGVIGALFTDWSGGSKKQGARVEPFVGLGAVGARGRF